MVTRGIDNWEKHKSDVFEKLKKEFGENYASIFINYYSKVYDSHNRSFLDYTAAFWLFDDYNYVKDVGTKFYAIVGTGGVGKTTLAKNVLFFLDNTFDLFRINLDIIEFFRQLVKFPLVDSMKSILLDEPDDTYHPLSAVGSRMRKVLGRCRQQKLFVCICATDLKDIPPYFYRKINVIFFIPEQGKAYMFKDNPRKRSYVIQKIRKDYEKYGYDVFFRYQHEKGCLMFDITKETPLSKEQEKAYLIVKSKEYQETLNEALDYLDIEESGSLSMNQFCKINRISHHTVLSIAKEQGIELNKSLSGKMYIIPLESQTRIINAILEKAKPTQIAND